MNTETSWVNDPSLSEVKLTYSARPDAKDYPILDCPEDIYGYLSDAFDQNTLDYQEQFIVLLFNSTLRVIGWSKISAGGKSATVVDIPMVVQLALLSNASSVVIAHNHPDRTLRPSAADINLTKRIKKALDTLTIRLNDHLIITRGEYYSFKEHGRL